MQRLATSGQAGAIDPDALSAVEREVYDRWADSRGAVGDRDIDTLLRQNVMLRRLIGELVANAGHPKPKPATGGYVAEVPTEVLEVVGAYADFSHVDAASPDAQVDSGDWR